MERPGHGDPFRLGFVQRAKSPPDLRGRFIVEYDDSTEGVAMKYNVIGEEGGNNRISLTIENMPKHTHKALKRACRYFWGGGDEFRGCGGRYQFGRSR